MSERNEAPLADQIDALLPQTQCRKCGYQGCRPYAEAICNGEADIDQCPPGGDHGIQLLADLLNVPAKPLNPAFGITRPLQVAVIDEAACIGCTKCLPPCPTDAILGASKQMHTVIAALCTGCELCIAPCPVNCISMVASANTEWTTANADQSRQRHQAKNRRQAKAEAEKSERLNRQKQLLAKLNKGKTAV
ncbi:MULTISPECIES: RnfABCDGE type electron transport complex subunit B [Methylomonas]|uniref:Electron transporter RnfB n=2 Tax=Methylomonas TaxID=416 RepID=A0A126T2Q1_9GAMM|nr:MULTISPECIES: RnfABCDGE type electron transport complex subunit B [Methylomonas]AMK76339.1 electron transporter RnfB [Methylomonas denitrificans]OAI00774.1 electron transporter RnfB [Methylomonas methanica]TCV88361.1 electron transport complex protein RnfB [Methylomonas methanica]